MEDSFAPIETWTIGRTGDYGRDPRVCADVSGRWWVAWISWEPEGECVRYCHREPGASWSVPKQCTPHRRMVTALAMAPWREGVLIAWIDSDGGDQDGLKLRTLETSALGEAHLVVQSRRAPANPAIATDSQRFLLAWSSSAPGGRRIEAAIGADLRADSIGATVSTGPGLNQNPAVALHAGEPWVAWQSHTPDGSRILMRLVGAPKDSPSSRIAIDGGAGITASPDLLSTPAGIWIAWQSDVGSGKAGLVRWIDVAVLDKNRALRAPAHPMIGVERDGRGEDQGFEAPRLVSGAGGRLVIIGRGSQSLRRQDLAARGWTARARIDVEGWRCRSPRYDACACDGGVLVAGREKDRVTVALLPGGDAKDGAPTLGSLFERSPTGVARAFRPPAAPTAIASRRVLFGDIHQHTAASDGTGTATETFVRARRRYGDELCAVADHESFLGKRTPPGEWAELCRIADEHYEPGAFVTLHAFEWTGKMHPGPGHKVGYLPPRGGPVLSREDPKIATSAGLLDACRRLGAIAIPHHVGWTGADMDSHDPIVQPCWEIVSCHGAYERRGVGPIGTRGDDKEGQFVCDALDRGLRFGLVGGSDGHGLNWHHGVCRMEDSHRSGLTAVLAEDLTREAVFEALCVRRCYATSGARIGLWFEVAGLPMGEEIPVTESVPFRVAVRATDEVESLCLVTNGGREIRLEAGGTEIDARGTLPSPPDGGWAYYFARVVQVDGHVAWSSPIWLDAPGSPGSGLPAA